MKRSPFVCLWLAVVSRAAPMVATSDVHTVHFGVEADRVNSTRLDNRHVDIDLPYCGGGGNFRIVADPPPSAQTFAWHQAHLYANSATRETATVPPAYGFLGVVPGNPYWIMQQSQFSGEIYLGVETSVPLSRLANWDPDGSATAYSSGKWMEIRLVAVRGPANSHFSVFQYGTPPRVYFATSDGINASDRMIVSAGGHDHFNWCFTRNGLYEVDLQVVTVIEDTPGVFAMGSVFAGETSATVTWNSDPCHRFTLEATETPSLPGSWTVVPGFQRVAGISGMQTGVDTLGPGQTRKVYRVWRAP